MSSIFPHLLAPNLLPLHSFPQFSSLRAHFINPLSTWLPASLLCHTLSPPVWSWARKSIIELLITVWGGGSRAQLLTQQIPMHQNKPYQGRKGWLRTPHSQALGWDWLPRSRQGVALLSCPAFLPLHPRINPFLPTQLGQQKSLFHCRKQSKY